MTHKHSDLFEESKGLFEGEGYEDGDFLTRPGRDLHATNGNSSPSKRGKWFDLPRLDDLFSSKDRASRSKGSDSESKEEKVKMYPTVCPPLVTIKTAKK
jgi:hypothetical protein